MQLFVSSMLSKLSEAARGVKSQLRTSSVIVAVPLIATGDAIPHE
jgi:hypothetical protein